MGVALFADQSSQMQISGLCYHPQLLFCFAPRTSVRRFALVHLQLPAAGTPATQVRFLRPLHQQDLVIRVETIQKS